MPLWTKPRKWSRNWLNCQAKWCWNSPVRHQHQGSSWETWTVLLPSIGQSSTGTNVQRAMHRLENVLDLRLVSFFNVNVADSIQRERTSLKSQNPMSETRYWLIVSTKNLQMLTFLYTSLWSSATSKTQVHSSPFDTIIASSSSLPLRVFTILSLLLWADSALQHGWI
jgi:hypothetical protein